MSLNEKDAGLLTGFNQIQASKCTWAGKVKSLEDPLCYVPSLRTDHAALYRTVLYALKPRRILEAGTLFGYSSIFAGEILREIHGEDFRIDTVELISDNVSSALKNIQEAGLQANIRVIEGDAAEVFSCLQGPYDLIFLDCSKSSYDRLLDDAKRLLRKGGMLLADDIQYHGKLEDQEEGEVPHKHRTIVNSLKSFLSRISDDNDFAAFADTMDDGLLVALKK